MAVKLYLDQDAEKHDPLRRCNLRWEQNPQDTMLLFQYPDLPWEQASTVKPFFLYDFWADIIFPTDDKMFFKK